MEGQQLLQHSPWTNDAALADVITAERDSTLAAYRAKPISIREHANQEESFRTGGYGNRQLLELVQNAADAILRGGRPGRIEIRLSGGVLYCANEGEAVTRQGVEALSNAFVSDKRGDEIGRFGLGFKSVLSVTSNPQVLSRSASFEFGGPRAAALIRSSGADERVPNLRVPLLIEARDVFAEDGVAAEMAAWATTIIRLPALHDVEKLVAQLKAFETQFLLFAPAVSELVLRAEEYGIDQRYRAERAADGTVSITGADGSSSQWLVRIRDHKPTLSARAEVGEMVARKAVRLTIASRIDSTEKNGAFWAYFPLKDKTTTSAIFNAPWRVNDDRTTLIGGIYNDELLQQFSEMFVELLPLIPRDEDAARHLDYLPSRPKERLSDADYYLSTHIPELTAGLPLLPDLNGRLQPGRVFRFLDESALLPIELITAWSEAARRAHVDELLPHERCYSTPERRTRLREILDRDTPEDGIHRRLGIAEWLGLLAEGRQLPALEVAVLILGKIRDSELRKEAARARIIPVGPGPLARASDTDAVFLRGDEDLRSEDLRIIDQRFVERPEIEDVLERLGFRELDPERRLLSLMRLVSEQSGPEQWERLWDATLDLPAPRTRELFARQVSEGLPMFVRSEDGIWRPSRTVALPIAGRFDPTDPALRIDTELHGSETALLRAAGAICGADSHWNVQLDDLFADYSRETLDELKAEIARDGLTSGSALMFAEREAPGSIDLLVALKRNGDDLARLQWSRLLLAAEAPRTWTVTRRGAAGRSVESPHLWAIRRHGLILTSAGPRDARVSLDPELAQYAAYLPVALDQQARRLKLVDDLDRVPKVVWEEFLRSEPRAADPAILASLIERALRTQGERPEVVPAVRAGVGANVESRSVVVAVDADERAILETQGTAYLFVPDAARAATLAESLGATLASNAMSTSIVTEGPHESRLALDRFPGLRRMRIQGDPLRLVSIVPCDVVATEVAMADGVHRTVRRSARQDELLFVQTDLDDRATLAELNREFSLELSQSQLADVLQRSAQADVDARIVLCATEPDPAAKLLILATDSQIRKQLPKGLLDAVRHLGGGTSPRDVANLFLKVYGSSALQELKTVLQVNGLPAPSRWAGSSDAADFVSRLGFDAAFAGEPTISLERTIQIPGQVGLPPLHQYQEELADRIREVVRTGSGREAKALMYLPTGAGKTRVAVEALVRSILAHEVSGPVLWIAQSEELCEQAVQTWSTVWRRLADSRTMSISRLWGQNEIARPDSDVSVVVATDAKLLVVKSDSAYDWLSEPSVVVIDEAHRAGDTPSYTAILRWLGVDGNAHQRPLLGLTATPYKGTSLERTQRLASRFGKVRLEAPSLGEDPYEPLQAMGVLAKVKQVQLRGVDSMNLSPDELRATSLGRFSPSTLDSIAADTERTIRIVEHIASLPEEWPVLVFTPSVLNAQILAALLLARNIEAAPLSGSTRRPERRRVIREFGEGRIQVLTNCDVLTQGFDAPGVRALYLAKPTLSPNAYIQMVGRGLRGPLNGGKEECLIVDVADTFKNFHGELAYHQFDHLWSGPARS
jgi:superfamily II DNA or RNA helicase